MIYTQVSPFREWVKQIARDAASRAGIPLVDWVAAESAVDAGSDAGTPIDAGVLDAGAAEVDGGVTDAGALDAGATDAGASDAGTGPNGTGTHGCSASGGSAGLLALALSVRRRRSLR
jgi:hypothetical protein